MALRETESALHRSALGLVLLVVLGTASIAPLAAQTTILPTDVVPIQTNLERSHPPNRFAMRMLQRLPASFYVNSSVETTFRLETNPYQYPLKRTLLPNIMPRGVNFPRLSKSEQAFVQEDLRSVAAFDNVYRINPSITAGWSPSNSTQFYVTYFLLRDSLLRHSSLNSTTQAVGVGAQHTYYIGDKSSIQPQITIRELYQTDEPNVLDYLPAVTGQYMATPNLALYLNALMQVRMRHFMAGHGREINPFYTAGLQYQRGRWVFLVSATFLQNFRKPFGGNSLIPVNNDSVVCDFEIDRQVSPRIPGLQAIIRAEPVYNFHSHATPGLAGMDFRLYYGLRLSAAKPAFPDTVKQLRQRYKRGTFGTEVNLPKPAADIAAAEDPT